MTAQSTQRLRIASGAVTTSLGVTTLSGAYIVPNRDDTAALPSCTPTFQYAESPIATPDFEGATTAAIDFNLAWSWPTQLMYPAPGQGEENRIRQLLKSGAPTAATTEVTGVVVTNGISFGGQTCIQLAAAGIDTGVEVGDVIRIRDSGNNLLSFGEVFGVTSGVLYLLTSSDIVDGSGRKVLRGRRFKPNTVKEYCPIEFASLDTSPQIFQRLIDTIPDTWTFGGRNGQLGLKGGWSGLATAYAQANSAYSSGLVTETASPLLSPKTDNTILRYGSTTLASLAFDARIQHPLGQTKFWNQLAATDLVPGRLTSSGSFQCFLDADTRIGFVQAGSAASLLYVSTDMNKQSIAIRWPSVKLTNDVLTRDQTYVSEQISWQSQRDTAVDSVGVRILTFPA